MKVYIQSKSGELNSTQSIEGVGTLHKVLQYLRRAGSYVAEYRGKEVQVPFEEIEYIRKES